MYSGYHLSTFFHLPLVKLRMKDEGNRCSCDKPLSFCGGLGNLSIMYYFLSVNIISFTLQYGNRPSFLKYIIHSRGIVTLPWQSSSVSKIWEGNTSI